MMGKTVAVDVWDQHNILKYIITVITGFVPSSVVNLLYSALCVIQFLQSEIVNNWYLYCRKMCYAYV